MPEHLRGLVLAEDRRSERFFRHLLESLGHDKRNFRFETAPVGKGAAEAWVLKRYPEEVQVIRSKNFQRTLCLLAIRDGDASGVLKRKQQMDEALKAAGKDPRVDGERIGLPVPTWSIENWLFQLLGEACVNEERQAVGQNLTWKQAFDQRYSGPEEASAIQAAAKAWNSPRQGELPSLADGRVEISRIKQE